MAGSSSGGRSVIARSAFLVAALTALSTILGFGRDVVVGAVFGAGAELDAYLVAQGLMNLVMALIATAMARSAIPTVSREVAAEQELAEDVTAAAIGRDGTCRGHRGFDTALTLSLGVLGIGSLVMALAAAPVTSLLAPGFSDAQIDLAAELTRIMLIATVLVSGTDMLAGLAQAHGKVFYSAIQGIPFNLVMLVAAAVFGPRYGVVSLAVGFVVGSALRLLLQLIPLCQLRIPVRLRVAWGDPKFREIARLAPPILVGSAVANVNTMVDRAVGSTLGDGAITALSFSWRLVHLPETLFVAALLVPLYPAMSAAADQRHKLAALAGRGLSVLLTALVPITVLLIVAAVPIVSVAFGHGNFTQRAVSETATALAWSAAALLGVAVRTLLARACYAVGDSTGPLVTSVLGMVLNVIGNLALAPVMGIAGIALATSVSLAISAAVTGWWLAKKHGALDLPEVGASLARVLGAGIAALIAGAITALWLPDAEGFGGRLLALVVIGLVVLVSYLAALRLFRARELTLLIGAGRVLLRRR